MAQEFNIPEAYITAFRRIIPYLSAPLQNDPTVLEALVLYYKLGGEKMARIVVDALNVTRRMQDAEMIKQMREEAMLLGNNDDDDDERDEDEDDEDEDEDED